LIKEQQDERIPVKGGITFIANSDSYINNHGKNEISGSYMINLIFCRFEY